MFVTHDGRDLYFCSDRPDPKASALGERGAAGPAGAPVGHLGGSLGTETVAGRAHVARGRPSTRIATDYYPTLTLDGTLYVSVQRCAGSLAQNGRLSRRAGGTAGGPLPENLGAPRHTAGREYDPFIGWRERAT